VIESTRPLVSGSFHLQGGTDEIFTLQTRTDGSYWLRDTYAADGTPLRVKGTDPLGTYTYVGTVVDAYGFTDEVSITVTFVTTYTVTGTVNMQGRTYTGGVPMTLTRVDGLAFGPFSDISDNIGSNNLVITGVVGGAYYISTNMPRYLDVTILLNNKQKDIRANIFLPLLQLKGGDTNDDNRVQLIDGNQIGTDYNKVGDWTADVNYSGKVDIFDLNIVGGNWNLTSAQAYGVGANLGTKEPIQWLP